MMSLLRSLGEEAGQDIAEYAGRHPGCSRWHHPADRIDCLHRLFRGRQRHSVSP